MENKQTKTKSSSRLSIRAYFCLSQSNLHRISFTATSFPRSFLRHSSSLHFLRRLALRLCIHLIRERLSLKKVKRTRRPQDVLKSGISSRNLNLRSYAWAGSIIQRKPLTYVQVSFSVPLKRSVKQQWRYHYARRFPISSTFESAVSRLAD